MKEDENEQAPYQLAAKRRICHAPKNFRLVSPRLSDLVCQVNFFCGFFTLFVANNDAWQAGRDKKTHGVQTSHE